MSQELNEKSIRPRSLPSAWVEKIFSTMMAFYGSRFADMWRDADAATVKAVWAEQLAGFYNSHYRLEYALKCLAGREWPPTLPEFISDCQRAPLPYVARVECKINQEENGRNKEKMREIMSKFRNREAA